jgi:hypothetical protein
MTNAPAHTLERVGDRLTRAVGVLAGRLAQLLSQLSGRADEPLQQSQNFLWSAYETAAGGRPLGAGVSGSLEALEDGPLHPIDRLVEWFDLSGIEVELLLLAAMPEEHEGYSAVLRALHPKGDSRPSLGLAAQLLFAEAGGRRQCRQIVDAGPLFRKGIVKLADDAPLFDRSLLLAEALWPALHGIETTPAELVPLPSDECCAGLDRWFSGPQAQRAIQALHDRQACTIAVTGEDANAAFHRAAALVTHAGYRVAGFASPASPDANWHRMLHLHAAVRDEVPLLRLSLQDPSAVTTSDEPAPPPDWPGPLLVAGAGGPGIFAKGRALISVPMEPLGFVERRRMWSALAPCLADSADHLAGRYPLEPYRVQEIARDLELIEEVEDRAVHFNDVAEALRARSHRSLSAGVRLLRPRAEWEDLVLPRDLMTQLHEAVDRLMLQSCVLDDWGFLKNRAGTRGVRLLFAGPPGTGKTLSAEVLAHAVDADLLVVDVSRVVSKWVGETEKNLAAVFDAAENSQAVLLFDEADALFSKRTEVSDARDRYANLETAYLLQRLERFEGLAILATNLRQNIDAAFVRRLEFVLEFSEPDREQRAALWKRHMPADAPLDPALNFYELAALYPVVGGVIRNAAVAAAFRAAADGMPLCRNHFIHAIRREYEKAGRAFPGLPAGMRI